MKPVLDDRDDPVPPKQNVQSGKLRIIALVVSCIALGCATRWLVNLASERYGYSRGGIFVQAVVCGLLMLLGLWVVLHRIGVFWRLLGALLESFSPQHCSRTGTRRIFAVWQR